MKLRCWPGCTAITSISQRPENNGIVVTCLEFVGIPPEPYEFIHSDYWRVDKGLTFRHVDSPDLPIRLLPYARDAYLIPLTPPPGVDIEAPEKLVEPKVGEPSC